MGYVDAHHAKNFNVDKIEAALNMSRILSSTNEQVNFIPSFSNGRFAPAVEIVGKHTINFDKKMYKQFFGSIGGGQSEHGDDDEDDDEDLPQKEDEGDDESEY